MTDTIGHGLTAPAVGGTPPADMRIAGALQEAVTAVKAGRTAVEEIVTALA